MLAELDVGGEVVGPRRRLVVRVGCREMSHLMTRLLEPGDLVEHDALQPATGVPELVCHEDAHRYRHGTTLAWGARAHLSTDQDCRRVA